MLIHLGAVVSFEGFAVVLYKISLFNANNFQTILRIQVFVIPMIYIQLYAF